MSGYGAVFMYSSTIAAPVPLDRVSRPKPPRRPEKHRRPPPQQHLRRSSGSDASSRSLHETPGPETPSKPAHAASPASAAPPPAPSPHCNGPAAAATTSATTAASAVVGRDDSYSQLAKASAAAAATAAATLPSLLLLSPRRSSSGRAPNTLPRMHRARPNDSLASSIDVRNAASSHPEQDSSRSPSVRQMSMSGFTNRAESISSTSGHTSISARTVTSSGPSAAGDSSHSNHLATRPFVQRHGRTYLNDTNLPYPLPSDLTELHRQTLRTLLLIQVFGAPVCSPYLTKKPPQRVLEIGCGSGFWSMMCHQYFKSRGHGGISFTGIDVAPLAPDSAEAMKPDLDMNWKFVQHDLRQLPWPLPAEEYDLVMVKDMSLATTNMLRQAFIDEYIRMLRPGGTLEIWESDHLIRMLRPHVPGPTVAADDADDQLAASSLGAYVINANTPLSAPLNTFLVDYNQWLSRSLESRDLTAVPCALVGSGLLQESESLSDVRSRRLAIPLSEVRWEREGVGGVITKDGKPHAEAWTPKVEKKTLTAGQMALRQTALLTVVQQVQALEPILREVSGKSQDEWDVWLGKMMGDLMSEGGTSWGECLEVGAWSAKKMPTA